MQDVPRITTGHIQSLLASSAQEPVLYVEQDEDTGEVTGLDVWARAYVAHGVIVLTRQDACDALGSDPSAGDIAHLLPDWQEVVEEVMATLA